MKILRVVTRLNIGGPSLHVLLLSAQLDPQRFTTCLVAGEPASTEGDLSELARGAGVRMFRLSSLRRSIRPWADLVALVQVLRIVTGERPEIIHTHTAKAGTIGRLAGILYNRFGHGQTPGARAILVHTFHGHVLEGYFPVWMSRFFVTIERWLARRTDCLIAVSQRIRDELLVGKGIGRPDQWRVIPLGLNLSALADLPLPERKSEFRIGVVGRLVPIKNPGLFLRALHRVILQEGTDQTSVSGVIVGDGPLRKTLEDEVKQLGLDRIVRFSGWQRDLSRVYEGLEAACLTSWNEGTPASLIEAMAAGRAVVATDVGGVRDLLEGEDQSSTQIVPGGFRVTDRGVLVRPGDTEGLAAALRMLARDAGLRTRLGQSAREHVVQHYAHERLLIDMASLYEALQRGRQG